VSIILEAVIEAGCADLGSDDTPEKFHPVGAVPTVPT